MERERKFLVTTPPSGLKKNSQRRIRQGYLVVPNTRDETPVEVRVRDENGKHVLTVKGGRGGTRTETEMPIAAHAFRSRCRLTQGKRLEKVRYRIPLGKLVVELDVYRGKLRALMTAEVEFNTDRQLRSFRPPEWLGQEITGREEFSNSRLATTAEPPVLTKS